MITVGAYEVKTNLSKLLDKVTKGERIVITRHGNPVALLSPSTSMHKKKVDEVIKDIIIFQTQHSLNGLSLKTLISEGRE